jgi:hypothetical protein
MAPSGPFPADSHQFKNAFILLCKLPQTDYFKVTAYGPIAVSRQAVGSLSTINS